MNLAENYPIEMRSLLKRMIQLYGKTNAKTIADALPDNWEGHTFQPKGTVATVNDLPDTGNEIWDMYHVTADEGEYVWWPTTEYPDGHWEFMGSSGTAKFVVTLTNTGTAQYPTYSADKTLEDIGTAYTSGECVVLHVDDDEYPITNYDSASAVFSLVRSEAVPISGTWKHFIKKFYVEVQSNADVWSYNEFELVSAPNKVADGTSTSITLASAADNTEYVYGELSALTISAITVTGWFTIIFTSGSTATVLTTPNSMNMPDGFSVEANTRYEINCKNGYAVVTGWAVS